MSRLANVQTTISELGPIIRDLQSRAPQGSRLTTCYTSFQNLMRSLDGGAAKKTADSASYLVNNVFTVMLGDGSTQEKLSAIDRYITNLTPRSTAIRGMVQPIERLRDDVLAGAAALGRNSVAIGNHFTNIIEGLQTIIRSYEQINSICSQIRAQVAQGSNARATIQQETRWLTAIAKDFNNFNPPV